MQPLSRASSIASMTSFSIKGSGIWTADLFSDSKESEANCEPPIPSLPVALSYVIKESEKNDKILVTGSFHTVGEVRKLLIMKQKLLKKRKRKI